VISVRSSRFRGKILLPYAFIAVPLKNRGKRTKKKGKPRDLLGNGRVSLEMSNCCGAA
jgi:hypothetical protein